MKKIQLNMLLNSCQNQWRSVISRNENFRVRLYGPNGYLGTLTARYTDEDLYYKYREQEVAYWEVVVKDELRIEITW